ncbi:carboxymuconolactone decarboxylase family protein [Streptomyces sp. NPDC046465]|uniref:carboxymuconolactone decarboxylase family protein n=1 Tax=Streptomyces sp. NPDC046465 TaxID=3155810 RepID=UPI00340334C6
MRNPTEVLPDVAPTLQALLESTRTAGVPGATLELVHLRTSQINGCATGVELGVRNALGNGETDERLHAVAAWRDASCFTGAERAALALAEHTARLADRTDAIPDTVWDEAAAHYDERQLAAIVLMIGVTNLFHRLDLTTRQPTGEAMRPEGGGWGEA